MKKSGYIWICLLLLLVGTVRAQESFRRELAIGVGGGTSFSQVSFIHKVQQKMKMGLHGGATIRWITEKNLGLMAEVNYAQQGWEEDLPLIDPEVANSGRYFYKRTINTVEIPFMTHIYFGGKRVRFFLNVGPKVGYVISESTSQNVNGATIPPTEDINYITEQHNMPVEHKFDWGICGGPGIELRTGAGSFLLEGRYYYALGDLYGNLKSDYFAKSSQQVITVKLSYLFTVKRW